MWVRKQRPGRARGLTRSLSDRKSFRRILAESPMVSWPPDVLVSMRPKNQIQTVASTEHNQHLSLSLPPKLIGSCSFHFFPDFDASLAPGAGSVSQDLGDTVDYVSGLIMHERAGTSLLEKVLMWVTISTDFCGGPFQGHGRFTPHLS